MAPSPKAAPKRGKTSPVTIGLIAAVVVAGGYLILKRRSAAATPSTALSGGGSIPPAIIAGATGGGMPTTLAQWMQQALGSITNAQYGPTAALNDLNDWLLGNCVSQAGYTAIGGIVQTLGLPPGYSTVPALSVCASSTAPPPSSGGTTPAPTPATPSLIPPNLPQSLVAAMTANGEALIGAPQWDAKLNEWIAATNKGGIYALGQNGQAGPTFYGSYLGLPAAGRQGAPRTFSGLTIDPATGFYTLTATDGSNYTFTPTTPQGG